MKSTTIPGIVGSLLMILSTCQAVSAPDRNLSITSPDQRTEVIVTLSDKILYQVLHDGQVVIMPSSISMTLDNGDVMGANPKLTGKKSRSNQAIVVPLYGINSKVPDNFNELNLSFGKNFSLIFRAYNEGIAYRFVTKIKDEIIIKNEEASFTFKEDYGAFFIRGNKEKYIYEGNYLHEPISKIDSGRVAVMPITVGIDQGPKISLTESDLEDYPGMYLENKSDHCLSGTFRNYPVQTDTESTWAVRVKESAGYIAKTSGTRSFPWRIIMISDSDKDLLNNELVYLLAPEPAKDMDFSWVRPGKIINDWWDAIWLGGHPQEVILSGVDFKSGTNYETYKYYIDFAVEQDIDYVNLDYGWSDDYDLTKVYSGLDLPKLLSYSKEKNKKVFLWCLAKVLYKDLEANMTMFEQWGIGGLKVDFLERDDQLGINDYMKIAESAARHHLLVEFHGATKPTGLSRAYPNVLTYEAVLGSEFNKNYTKATPGHDVTIPFMRNLAGAFDYGPGAMDNANESCFRPINDHPMSQGTRCHQLAMFMVYYSPLQFMIDVPTNYIKEPVYLDFLKSIPAVWDVTYPLDSKIGEYVSVAREKGDIWYVGAMTNWNERQMIIPCDFLDNREYTVEIFQDGLNANLNSADYTRTFKKVRQGDALKIHLAKGGGWAARFVPVT
ncbi:MAG: glycoside hydrolase family 97 protein [Bacteroidota bacterium]